MYSPCQPAPQPALEAAPEPPDSAALEDWHRPLLSEPRAETCLWQQAFDSSPRPRPLPAPRGHLTPPPTGQAQDEIFQPAESLPASGMAALSLAEESVEIGARVREVSAICSRRWGTSTSSSCAPPAFSDRRTHIKQPGSLPRTQGLHRRRTPASECRSLPPEVRKRQMARLGPLMIGDCVCNGIFVVLIVTR
jgi:hypothetical protein